MKLNSVGNDVRIRTQTQTGTHKVQEYDAEGASAWHYFLGLAAGATLLGIWLGEKGFTSWSARGGWLMITVALLGIIMFSQIRWMILLLCVCAVVGGLRSHSEWSAVHSAEMGPFTGRAVLVTDPEPVGAGVRIVSEIAGQRFESWLYGSKAKRAMQHVAGESLAVIGQREPTRSRYQRRLEVRHIVGRFEVSTLSDVEQGAQAFESRFMLAANRVRSALSDGAQTLSGDQGALFSGLVYGDDSQQPDSMVRRFRSSGLAHLTAVSGQNVAFILAVVAPVLSRLKRSPRLVVTLLILAWFAIMTRVEPSVVRAVTMAGISAIVFAAGRTSSASKILATTMLGLFIIDPFLVWSVGWWLSVGGSGGLILLSQPLKRSLERTRMAHHPWLMVWIVPSLAAQLGVLPVSVMIFGWPSAMSVPCNLLAVPVAGIVMLLGVPVALAAGFAPVSLAHVLMWPFGIGVRWVDTVAAIGERLQPPMWINLAASTSLVGLGLWAMLPRHRCDNLEI